MDDEEFIDLLTESETIGASSQESLTTAATSLTVCDDATEVVKGRSPVIRKIESVFADIADGLLEDREHVEIQLLSRPKTAMPKASPTSSGDPSGCQPRTRTVKFPGKNADEAWRFAMVIRILEITHEALDGDKVVSKRLSLSSTCGINTHDLLNNHSRDIYYRDPALFGSQSRVDRLVDDIAFTFGVQRSMLNVTAVAKGLVAGAAKFCFRNGSILDAAETKEGVLVPTLRELLSVNLNNVEWILVIEKEATFRSIAAGPFWDTVADRGLILTGKGYPDIATRALLHFLSTSSPRNGFASPPVYGLADFDPDGLAILSTYKHGSVAMAHENENLKVPDLRWIGLHVRHMLLAADHSNASRSLLQLTARDRKKAYDMLAKAKDEDFSNALLTMLMLNLKAELQLLDEVKGGFGMCDILRAQLP